VSGAQHAAAVGVRATYDAIAGAYDEQLRNELDGKPLDRALLAAFLELAGTGPIADLGCGPGHLTSFLAGRHAEVIGMDLSIGMLSVARKHAPELPFVGGSLLELPLADAVLAGAIAFYSIIHLRDGERRLAAREIGRVLRPGCWLLLAFHIDSAEYAMGQANHLTEWFGRSVELDGYFLDPAVVAADLRAAGFTITAELVRQPNSAGEYPSRRCYLLAQRS
jgi:SAM-dependent methyltransferase